MFGRFNPLKKKTAQVLGVPMAYVEHGKGDPIVLLHGNPTSSYLWREVIPPLAEVGRCIAPDLIGMGDSARIEEGPNCYKFSLHAEYVEAFLHVMGIDSDVTLVLHDWGGPLGIDWGRRHAEAVKAVVFMETIITPYTWDMWPEEARSIFQGMRSEAGETIILEKNVFVERILPSSVMRELTDEEMDVYRKPYREQGESRRPTLTWPREIPIDGEPAFMVGVVERNREWLREPDVPKLFINADPGMIVSDPVREVIRSFENLSEVTVPGLHFIQEDSGKEIGEAIAAWLPTI